MDKGICPICGMEHKEKLSDLLSIIIGRNWQKLNPDEIDTLNTVACHLRMVGK